MRNILKKNVYMNGQYVECISGKLLPKDAQYSFLKKMYTTVTCAVRETEKKVYTTVTCAVRETEKSVYNFLQTYRCAQISHHYLALHNYNTQLFTA